MTLATEVKKLAESKPFYAVAGVGDFAAEKLRELPEQLQRLQGRREEIREAAKDLPEKAREFAGKAEVYAKDFSGKAEGYAKDFPDKARGYADHFTGRAVELYEEFASRGRKVVSKSSGEAALELEEISEKAEPAIATQATRKNNRTPKNTSTRKA
ncbi:hypothetical protein OHA77_16560 [Streptosporangium sp. NBC_01639]|uniref:hypothetical protein n=1 Tax=unclassified Streptosporangium TaxID=2632669 RepID=UPI002DDB5BB9|nr:hypothetical protein [Streptosporangium sp. NBC_01756]WSC83348.1 hypothetical protein OIE48_23360 [Streptosporangium sp. NBC_01756]WTD58078.1 hypothetical protein OHA77_16560 [Streptosporangium sp. NBC_01639]